ncbi:ribokinase [Prosthecobacter dejongeii]|uniref:Ribokinase n=1 Tax=Prosthecobacter dejongeii TaxID=48465 RepID=A0A7W7YMH0_9BACT|nr:ribokinase [Prosthecobacter dejongeii]MBB5038685.1 ribokinase [Prosthecobacter dejongeii]
MARNSAASVVVVGSMNVDLIASVKRLPAAGETVAAASLEKRFGGKGANQALAAARHGALVTLIGCLGDDPDGRDYRNHLRREGINCSAVNTVKGGTGNAFIAVDAKGENQIIVIPGANAALTAPALKMQRSRIEVAKALLIQLEVPLETVVESIKLANGRDVPVVLNPSPIHPDFPWGEVAVTVLIVNSGEAQQIFGADAEDMAEKVDEWKTWLGQKKIRTLIVTRGEKSTLVLTEAGLKKVAAHKVKAVDTVGAGDTFAGAFTTHLAEGAPLLECVRWANAAGALATLKVGAQEGIPHRGDVQSALNA